MTGRTAPWRRPALAPVYGVVVAFGAVALASLVVAPQDRLTVSVTAAEGMRLPAGLRVEVRDGDRVLAGGGLDERGSWSAALEGGDHRVCLSAPAGWTVTGPSCQQVPGPPADVVFGVEPQ